ncbi:MAG TPA: type I 3-dehydroquinate dehydratase [Thermoanaerobaculia bacterium]|nr:type I 3-dehydroquinate dehydratase [Thermoanaerobaculia bacterium]
MDLEQTLRAHLIATLTRPPAPGDSALLPDGVDWVELRADVAGEPEPRVADALARELAGGLVYTLRSRAEGGAGPDDPARRAERLVLAGARASLYALVDLEADRDLHPEVLEAIPPERRLLSWHGPASSVAAIEERIEAMTRTPARLYKLVIAAAQPGEELAPLLALAAAGRRDVVAFASGQAGAWTRLVAPRLGAPVAYGAFPGEDPAAPGQPGVDRLVADYGLPELPPVEALYGIVGRPVIHSLSPRLHNRAYRALGIHALYLPFHAERFGDFWLEVVEDGRLAELGLPLRGLSVTSPYKEAALAVAGAPSPRAQVVAAANTLIETDGVWEAESTDPEGVVLPLRRLGVELAGLPVAVVGAGGAGRSAVVGLKEAGARVTLVNRSEERGRQVAADLGVAFAPLAGFGAGAELESFGVVVHATTLGRDPSDPLPFDPGRLRAAAVLVDLVYLEGETPLLAAARAAGRRAVDGREVLIYQALEQFRLMTGRELPIAVAREALGLPPDGEPRETEAGEG